MEFKKGGNQALEESREFCNKTAPVGEITIMWGQPKGSSRAWVKVEGIQYLGDVNLGFFSEILKPDLKASGAQDMLLMLMQYLPTQIMIKDESPRPFSYGFVLSDREGNRLPDDDPRVKDFVKNFTQNVPHEYQFSSAPKGAQ